MHDFRPIRLLACLAAIALTVMACGDDDSTSTPAVPGESPVTDGATSPEVFGASDCADVVQDFVGAMSAFTQAFSGAPTDNAYEDAAELLDSYASAAPEEIQDSFQVLAEEMGNFYDAFAEIDYTPGEIPDAETQALLAQLGEVVDEDALSAASDEIEQWFEANCGE